jgi:hypothetical protein
MIRKTAPPERIAGCGGGGSSELKVTSGFFTVPRNAAHLAFYKALTIQAKAVLASLLLAQQ